MSDKFIIDLSNMSDVRNGKIIPSEVMLDSLIKFRNEMATMNHRMYIEFDEKNATVNLAKVLGYVKDLDIDLMNGVRVKTNIHIMSTPMGEVLKNVINANDTFIGRLVPRGYIEYNENGDVIPIITSFSLTSSTPDDSNKI